MGVYLSTPNTELEGTQDGTSAKLAFGAASMQGWRVGQEDAHIAIADYDADTSLFGVFDGHGGPEVAKYCAQHLPQFIKSLNTYQTNQLKESLEEAFLKFDKSLTLNEVIQELKLLSANPEVDNDENDTDDDINEAILLREEADLPITEVMKRYNSDPTPVPESESECGSSTTSRAGLSLPLHMRSETKERSKPVSPFLRAKRSAINECNHQSEETPKEGYSSSSKGEVSSSSSSSTCPSNSVTSEPADKEEDKAESTAQPESSEHISESKTEDSTETSNGVKNSDLSQVSNGEIDSQTEDKDSKSSTDSTENSDNKIESSTESVPTTNSSENDDKSVDSSATDNTDTPYKGKGKYKKIITPKVIPDSTSKTETPDKPIFEYFLEDFDEEEEESDDSEDFEGNDESSDEEMDDESESEDEEDEEEGPPAPCFERPGYDSGCTAVVALFKGNHLVVANAGDSRCVVSRDGKAIDMSVDHKPEDDIERDRITKAGGKVTRDGRVNGGLNLSRAIGDHAYKQNKVVSDRDQMITALPDIRTLDIDPKSDEFMVIACDGIWNSMTSQQVIDFVGERIQKTDKLSTICDELFRTCLAPNTHGDGTGCDNMTAVIVKFISTTLKRKLDESDSNSNDNNIDSTQTNDENLISSEPQLKRTKSEDSEVVPNQSTVNEVDASV